MSLGDWIVAGFGLVSGVVLWIVIAVVVILVIGNLLVLGYRLILLAINKRSRLIRKWEDREARVEQRWKNHEQDVARIIPDKRWALGERDRQRRDQQARDLRYAENLRAMPHALLPRDFEPGRVYRQNDDGSWSNTGPVYRVSRDKP